MTELVIIEFCGEPLALSREQFDDARARAKALRPSAPPSPSPEPAERLVDAVTLAKLTSLPQSWLEEQARRGSVPSLQLGKYRRFHVADALAAIRKLGRTA